MMRNACLPFFLLLFTAFTSIHAQPLEVSLITDTAWTNISKDNSPLPANFVSDIKFDGKGNVWIATWGGGLVKKTGDLWTIYNSKNSGLPNDLINHITFDSKGIMWIATDGDLTRFDGTNWKVVRLPTDENIALTVKTDHLDRVWVGTYDQGLFMFDGRQVRKMWGGVKSMEFGVNDVIFDRNNHLWMATRIGVLRYDGKAWTLFDSTNSALRSNMYYQLSFDSQGRLWAATYPPGNFGVYENGKWHMYQEPVPSGVSLKEFPGNYIYAMHITRDDEILTGSRFHGALALFDGKEMDGIATPLRPEEMGVSSLNIDEEGNIWVGSWKNGYYFLENPEQRVRETYLDSLQVGTFESRKLLRQRNLSVRSQKIDIYVWDNNKVDGDSVSISLNGEWLVKGLGLTKEQHKITVRLKRDFDNLIILHADNLGRIPPNTAAIAIVSKGVRREFILKSDMKKTGAIVVRYEPE